jgi:hypothetical protein
MCGAMSHVADIVRLLMDYHAKGYYVAETGSESFVDTRAGEFPSVRLMMVLRKAGPQDYRRDVPGRGFDGEAGEAVPSD